MLIKVMLGKKSEKQKVISSLRRAPPKKAVHNQPPQGLTSVFGMGTGVSPATWPLISNKRE